MNEIQDIYFEETNKIDYLISQQGGSKRIIPEKYSSYHYYHTIYPGLSDSEEYAKSDFDGWFYQE
jgi:hypothetical protein